MPERVFVPVDGSTGSWPALDLARVLGRGGARVTVAHVIEALPGTTLTTSARPGRTPWALARDHGEAVLAEAADAVGGDVRQQLIDARGAPVWQALLHAAHTARADVIVMGARGRAGLDDALLSPLAEQVLRHARVPVVLPRAGRPVLAPPVGGAHAGA